MRIVPSFVLAASVASGAIAQPVLAPTPAGKLTDLRVEREPIDAATLREGGFGGSFVTMRDELENFPLDTSFGGTGVSAPPTSFTGPEGFQWPLNNLRGQGDGSIGSGWVRVVDLSGAPVSGPNGVTNASKALRINTIVAQGPNGFFTGANLRFGGNETGIPTLPLEPLPGVNARVSAEHWVSSIDTLFSFEPVSNFVGVIVGRMMWGGTCVEDSPGECTDIGLPIGTIDSFVAYDPDPWTGWLFRPLVYCQNAQGITFPDCVPPTGSQVGDPARPPLQTWFRLATETTADGHLRFLVNHLDGQPDSIIHDAPVLTTVYMDRIGWNASFEAQDEYMLVDNIEASGARRVDRVPPPLECPYVDDLEWLGQWYLFGQSDRWETDQFSRAIVIRDFSGGNAIYHANDLLPNSRYRREMATSIPLATASETNDVIVSLTVASSRAVRGVALFDGEQLAARLFLGRDEGVGGSGWLDRSVYAQINQEYEPVDDPEGTDPYDNVPLLGVDVTDSGHDWSVGGEYQVLTLQISGNGALRISVNGQRIYAGPGTFTNSIDRVAFESENNMLGEGARFRVGDVTLSCDAPSCAADFDLDDAITFADLNAVLANFGASGLPSGTINPGDANSDGVVDFADLNAVLAAFGKGCD